MIKLREITEENFKECINLEVEENQKSFVARNVVSLAQAWLYPNNARPFAIYNDDTMVGFVMLDIDFDKDGSHRTCELWRLMIDKKYQGQGYGKAVIQELVNYVKTTYNPEVFCTSFVPGNESAQRLYERVGFKATGEIDEGEVVMELKF